jgi:heme-degrading monooxygenase HmoA
LIVRTWGARTTPANVAAYARHFRESLSPALERLRGFAGAEMLQRNTGADSDVEIVVVTRWASMDAVRGFAGDDVEEAVVEPAAAAVLTSYDRRVKHYAVLDAPPADGG